MMTFSDIAYSYPWHDDGWHEATVWFHDDGYTIDSFSDGDHEHLEKEDLLSPDQIADCWRKYHQHVLDTGEDPIGCFFVRTTLTYKERWEFKFSKSLAGIRVIKSRRTGKIYTPEELPDHVREYLLLTRSQSGRWTNITEAVEPSEQDSFEEITGQKLGPWCFITIERTAPRSPRAIARDLRKKAKYSLRRER